MADNYLERKMEDLKNGRLSQGYSRPAGGPKKGYIRFPMPSRRVLVIGGTIEPALSVARAFLKSDCKVAVLDKGGAIGDNLASNEGMRFITGNPNDVESICKAFENIISAWRGIDIVITPYKYALLVRKLFTAYKEAYKIPSDYGGRIIILSSESIPLEKVDSEQLKEWRITVNNIVCTGNGEAESVASIALFLSSTVCGDVSLSTILTHHPL
ncbi:MAG: NmrA family NAD(P)-binding protein [Muribaculaceae bacterium]|nr:NmrA family NAD(P)-binding protein [Muribaculaceae bacterium]